MGRNILCFFFFRKDKSVIQRNHKSRGNGSVSLRKLVAGFFLIQGSCVSQTNEIPQCSANDRVHKGNHILYMFTQREHKAKTCLYTVTKVGAKMDF